MKSKLCEVFDEVLFSENLTYEEMVVKTALTRSQIHAIMHKKATGVSLDRMVAALNFMEVELYLEARLWVEPDPSLLDQECPKCPSK